MVSSGLLNEGRKRFSLGLELAECTLDCSMELCDSSAATSMQDSSPLTNCKAHSFELEESLGILTPEQMIEFLDTNASHANLEVAQNLPLAFSKLKCPEDHTPSPEELPLDPIDLKTFHKCDPNETLVNTSITRNETNSQCDLYARTNQMIRSTTSKTAVVSAANSFVTSVTSIASLDNGYQGDGEMSRPVSRGAENSPMRLANTRQCKLHAADGGNVAVIRRPDPMTDSDFFTESDADDMLHRGDRHVQIIDGHMYNTRGADIFLDQRQSIESSGMDSSGIYTDIDQSRIEDDGQSLAIKTNDTSENSPTALSCNNISLTVTATDLDIEKSTQTPKPWCALPTQSTQSIGTLSNSSSTTINDSAATTYLCSAINMNNDSACAGSGAVGSGEQYNQVSTIIGDTETLSNAETLVHSVNRNSDNELSKSPNITHSSTGIKVKTCSSSRKANKSPNEIKSSSSKTNRIRCVGTMGNRSDETSLFITTPNEAGCNGSAVHIRKVVPNKWDVVMNKIAANKAKDVKKQKDYNQVKSKVACGLSRDIPTPSKTPLNEQSIVSDSTNKTPTLQLSRQSTIGVAKRYVSMRNTFDYVDKNSDFFVGEVLLVVVGWG